MPRASAPSATGTADLPPAAWKTGKAGPCCLQVCITRGINGTAIASSAKLGALTGGALFGTDLAFTAEVAFTGTNIDISFSLTDQNFDISTVGTSVAATEFTGEFFGFATRARTRGTAGKTNPWTMDYKNFGVSVTLLADENGNGINDSWELANFDNELLDESETHHPGGAAYYFLYLSGWTNGDSLDQAGRIGMVSEVSVSNPVMAWEFAEGFELGVHAEVWISTDLVDWAPLPSEYYSLTTNTTNGKTRHELEITHDYGDTVYLRLRKP